MGLAAPYLLFAMRPHGGVTCPSVSEHRELEKRAKGGVGKAPRRWIMLAGWCSDGTVLIVRHEVKWIAVQTTDEAYDAIKSMKVGCAAFSSVCINLCPQMLAPLWLSAFSFPPFHKYPHIG